MLKNAPTYENRLVRNDLVYAMLEHTCECPTSTNVRCVKQWPGQQRTDQTGDIICNGNLTQAIFVAIRAYSVHSYATVCMESAAQRSSRAC